MVEGPEHLRHKMMPSVMFVIHIYISSFFTGSSARSRRETTVRQARLAINECPNKSEDRESTTISAVAELCCICRIISQVSRPGKQKLREVKLLERMAVSIFVEDILIALRNDLIFAPAGPIQRSHLVEIDLGQRDKIGVDRQAWY